MSQLLSHTDHIKNTNTSPRHQDTQTSTLYLLYSMAYLTDFQISISVFFLLLQSSYFLLHSIGITVVYIKCSTNRKLILIIFLKIYILIK